MKKLIKKHNGTFSIEGLTKYEVWSIATALREQCKSELATGIDKGLRDFIQEQVAGKYEMSKI